MCLKMYKAYRVRLLQISSKGQSSLKIESQQWSSGSLLPLLLSLRSLALLTSSASLAQMARTSLLMLPYVIKFF